MRRMLACGGWRKADYSFLLLLLLSLLLSSAVQYGLF